MTAPQCSSCYYFEVLKGEPGKAPGRCHRFPPSLPGGDYGIFGEHCVVKFDGWCGEFRLPPGPSLAEMLRGEK